MRGSMEIPHPWLKMLDRRGVGNRPSSDVTRQAEGIYIYMYIKTP
jgi:hypothetical protein